MHHLCGIISQYLSYISCFRRNNVDGSGLLLAATGIHFPLIAGLIYVLSKIYGWS